MNQIWQKLLYFDGVVSNLPNFRELANEVMSSSQQGRRNTGRRDSGLVPTSFQPIFVDTLTVIC